ncbi:MAG: transposase [Gammaproteobacteria bacterium]|nr:transposase [Gammaproteobacteria bacterium]
MSYRDALAGRASLPKQLYHITVCTHHRQPFFADWKTGRLVVQELKRLQDENRVDSIAWVLMPDHIHWLMQLSDSASSLSDALRILKGRSARAVNKYLAREGRLWQRGFHEHAIRDDEDIQHIARYIVANPLRAKLVGRIADYPLWDATWL